MNESSDISISLKVDIFNILVLSLGLDL